MSLSDRIKAAREQWVTAGGKEFLIRRPTLVQLARWRNEEGSMFIGRCVVGWKIQESELVPGGSGRIPEFDAEAFREWVEDRPEIMTDLAEKIHELIKQFNDAQERVEKN